MVYSVIRSPLGWLGVISNAEGVVALLRGGKNRSDVYRKICKQYPSAIQREQTFSRRTRFFLANYFKGKWMPPPPINLFSQTPFQRKVLHQLRRIPFGQVRTYEWLSRRIQCRGGARACGQVLRKNPLPLLIPCHRIILKSGREGGFIWGKKLKKRLLYLEREK